MVTCKGVSEASKRRLRRRKVRARLAAEAAVEAAAAESDMKQGRDEVDRAAATEEAAGRERVRGEREARKLAKRLAKDPARTETLPARVASVERELTRKSTAKCQLPINLVSSDGVKKNFKKSEEILKSKEKTVRPDASTAKVGSDERAARRVAAPAVTQESIVEPLGPDSGGVGRSRATDKTSLQTEVNSKREKANKFGEITIGNEMGVETSMSKARLKAERRAKQEAQRAAKLAAAAAPAESAPRRVPAAPLANVRYPEVKRGAAGGGLPSAHRVNWFQHLYSERDRATSADVPINCKELHPAVVRLGAQLAARVVVGSNARCVALLHALKQVVTEYSLPARTEFARGLEAQLAASEAFLRSSRPPSASMTSAVKHLRWQLTQLPNNINEFEAKCQINEAIDTYIRDQIEVAGDAISIAVRAKISHGDNILTYGCSSLVEKILMEAWAAGLQFRAVVVDGGRGGGRVLLRRLAAHGVPTAYVHISALSFVMRTVHKVVLGAASLLGNGWVLAGAGTAQVALAARACNVPVLVCCQTHKFSERVQTDAFVYNEIGDPDALVAQGALRAWRQHASLTPLALAYDVTPPTLVTAVVTELAVLPCTSAPVVLRFKLSEYGL